MREASGWSEGEASSARRGILLLREGLGLPGHDRADYLDSGWPCRDQRRRTVSGWKRPAQSDRRSLPRVSAPAHGADAGGGGAAVGGVGGGGGLPPRGRPAGPRRAARGQAAAEE